jgi:hypothetical protein
MGASFSFAVALLMAASTAQARPYFNERFGYRIDLPPAFGIVNAADNGDGLSLQTLDGSAKLLVFGANILEGGLAAEVARRKTLDGEEGWNITYGKSGTIGPATQGSKAEP